MRCLIAALAFVASSQSFAQVTNYYGPGGQLIGQKHHLGNRDLYYAPGGQYVGQGQRLNSNQTLYYGEGGQYEGQSNGYDGQD